MTPRDQWPATAWNSSGHTAVDALGGAGMAVPRLKRASR